MKLWVLLLGAAMLATAGGPSLFYSKSFPKSTPAYVQINLDATGAVAYREAPDDDQPVKFQLKPAETKEVFDLADKLDHFAHPLEYPGKVAFTGTKTFRWENGAEKHEVQFNYTQDATARQLLDWFERMAESAQREIDLERTVKYDHLGIVHALLLLQQSMDDKRIVGADQYLPLLDRIVKNENFMHTAQERAADLAAAIRGQKPQAQ